MNNSPEKKTFDADKARDIMSFISTSFHEKPNADSIRDILYRIMQLFDTNRAYIVEYDWDKQEQSCIFEVCGKGIQPAMLKYKCIPFQETPWFTQRICSRKPIIINDLNTIPEGAYADYLHGRAPRVSSFILLPIITRETVVGYWGVDAEETNRRAFTEEDYHWLSAFTHLLSYYCALPQTNPQQEKIRSRQWELNESRLNSIYNHIPVGIEIYDKNGYLVHHNDKDAEIFGITDKEKVIGTYLFDNPILPQVILERLKNKEDVAIHLLYDFDKLNGYYKSHIEKGVKSINIKVRCIFDLHGDIDYYVFVISDNTESERIYTEVQDFQNMFSVIARYSKVGYLKFNLNTRQGFAAGEWYRNLGEEENTPLEDIIGIYRHVHEEDRKLLQDFYQLALQGESKNFSSDIRVIRPDGKIKWIHKNILIEKRKNGDLESVDINFDITLNKETEESLITACEKAEESNKLKSAFLADMSHEIRTPLNAIVGFSNVLAETDDQEEKKEYASIIEDNNEVLLQLINNVLDLSKIESGSLDFNYSATDINALLQDIETTARAQSKNDQLTISFKEYQPKCMLFTDRNRIGQVLTHFVNNAIKFTPEGCIRIGYRMLDKKTIYFYVSDTGTGIPQEKQEHIFDRFTKLDPQTQGTGLGLAICSTIIHKLGGEIGVTSKSGAGSKFWFTLPYTPVKNTGNRALPAPRPEKVSKNKLKILIAEDNASNFKLYESVLKKDYLLIHAWDGMEAVKLYKEHKPNLILMDIKMPRMDGYEATREIRRLSSTVPIVAVTAFAYESDETQILNCGFDGYAAKPLQIKSLKDKIFDLLKKRTF